MTLLDPAGVVSMLDKAPAAAVRVAPERCLNRRHKGSRCELCLRCPTGAVTAAGTTIMVDAAACVGCGLCYSVCPMEAFAVRGPRLSEILRVGAEWKGSGLQIACPRRALPDQASTAAAALMVLPCLAWVSAPLAVGLVSAGVTGLVLDDTPCAACKIGGARGQIAAAAATANALLLGAGRGRPVALLTSLAEGARTSRAVPVIDPVRPALSRRGLFGALQRQVTRAGSAVVEARLPGPALQRPPILDPAQTALLRASLVRLADQAGQADSLAVPVPVPLVSEACTACGLCAKICPTGALVQHQNETAYQLEARAALCLGEGCGICTLICPVKAVSLAPLTTLSEAGGGYVRVLRTGGLKPCARCGVPLAATQDAALCHACRMAMRAGAPLAAPPSDSVQ